MSLLSLRPRESEGKSFSSVLKCEIFLSILPAMETTILETEGLRSGIKARGMMLER